VKALVFIDHDIICRHFVMSGALSKLVATADVRFVFPDDGGKRVKLDPSTLPLNAPFERIRIDARRIQTWRWALFSDQLKLRPGGTEGAIRKLRWMTLGWKAALLLTVAAYPPIKPLFQLWIRRRLSTHPSRDLGELLDRERPDVVFHPSVLDGVFINDLVDECRSRNIPLVIAMNSWDNPSTKRAVVGVPDWLLVWGKQTREHAVRFMGIASERALPFGAAQFDVFDAPPRMTRADFAAVHGIDPNRRIVLFAGSNAQTDEFATLAALEQAIDDGRLPGVSIIYRPHPWGGGGRDGRRLAKVSFRHIAIHQPMRDYIARLEGIGSGITLPDYRDTHDLLSVVDVVVSPLSTILVEAALHAKPVAAFAPRGAEGSQVLSNNLPMTHFEEFIGLADVGLADNVSKLIALLPRLADPIDGMEVGKRLRKSAKRFVEPYQQPWRDRIVEFLSHVANRPRREIQTAAE
jgi:hypothetical protein